MKGEIYFLVDPALAAGSLMTRTIDHLFTFHSREFIFCGVTA